MQTQQKIKSGDIVKVRRFDGYITCVVLNKDKLYNTSRKVRDIEPMYTKGLFLAKTISDLPNFDIEVIGNISNGITNYFKCINPIELKFINSNL
ncbi:MAG: hypothetical protein ACI4PU_10195 [Intestinibacter sp.]